MIAPFALLAAALFTRSLGTFVSVPEWQPTNEVPSMYHAFGTYSGGYGSNECLRATAPNAAAVNALFDGAYERAWLGRDYGYVTNAVGVRADWDADYSAPRVITNSFRLLSWSNLTMTARALAYGDHGGWASDFGGEDLRALRPLRAEPPIADTWRVTFPCDTNGTSRIVADAWVDVFPCFSMLAGDDGSMYYGVRSYPRRHLGAWLGSAANAAGGVGGKWIDGEWADVLNTPLGGAIVSNAQEGVFYSPQTPTDFFAANVPRNDSTRLSRHFDAVVDVYTNAAVYVTNDLVRAVTNITIGIVGTNVDYTVYYWRTNDTSRLYVTNLTEMPPPVEMVSNVHHIVTNRAPVFAEVTNVVHHLRDLAFDVRQWTPDGEVTTNGTRRINPRTDTNFVERAEWTNSVDAVTNSTPASYRLDWYKAGALNRLEGAMTSTYAETNDLHLCRGRGESTLAIYAWLTNSVDHGFTFTNRADGTFDIDTNWFHGITWNVLSAPEIQHGWTNRTDVYHPTFRVRADEVRHVATAEMRTPVRASEDLIRGACDRALELSPNQYDGRQFSVRGEFKTIPYGLADLAEIIYDDGETNALQLQLFITTLDGVWSYDATNCMFSGGIAKSAAAIVYDTADASLLPEDAARLIPHPSAWSNGYVTAAKLYSLETRIAKDSDPTFYPMTDPSSDARAAAPELACSTGFRIASVAGLESIDAVRSAIVSRTAAVAAALATQTAADVDGRAQSSKPWALVNPAEIDRFRRDILPWQGGSARIEFGINQDATRIEIRGHVVIDGATKFSSIDAVYMCEESYLVKERAPFADEYYRVGWMISTMTVPQYTLEPVIETRSGTAWRRGTHYQIDGHTLPLIRTDWKWRCLTPTD